jgi:hypothetical protein
MLGVIAWSLVASRIVMTIIFFANSRNREIWLHPDLD